MLKFLLFSLVTPDFSNFCLKIWNFSKKKFYPQIFLSIFDFFFENLEFLKKNSDTPRFFLSRFFEFLSKNLEFLKKKNYTPRFFFWYFLFVGNFKLGKAKIWSSKTRTPRYNLLVKCTTTYATGAIRCIICFFVIRISFVF